MNIFKKSGFKSCGLVAAILALGAGALALTGCNDFLDQEVLGNNTADNFYDTKYKLQSALNATYDILQTDALNNSDWRFGEALGDHVDGADEGLTSHMGQLSHFRFNTSNTVILDRWKIYYKGIHRANQVIANAHRVRLSTNDYQQYREVREILGQAKFLRAFFYFNLVKTFGGVPIRPETETVEGLVVPRSTREETYAYIEKDLREAAIMLPNRFTGSNCGKAGSGAAVALLMKVLMYQATPGELSDKWEQMVQMGGYFVKGNSMTLKEMLDYPARYTDADGNVEDWEELRKALWFKPQALNSESDPYEGPDFECPKLSNAYSLDYKDAYGTTLTYDQQFYSQGEFCSASIFEIVFKESGDGTSGDTNEGTGIYQDFQSVESQIWSTSDYTNRIFGSDKRKDFTIGHHETLPDFDNTEIGSGRVLSLKWYIPRKDRPTYKGDSDKNRRLIRMPEVVLMYAEALNECGHGAEALEQLNSNKKVVNAINNSSTLYNGGGYGYMRNQIWSEREMELAFEWDRFFDIVRQGRAKEILRSYADKKSNHRGLYFREGINEVFPIPQTEIDVSNGVVTQNPGY